MAFQNRRAEHLNRKKMTVVSEITNSSGQKVITVDVERAEGNVYAQGTPLNAESLNAEIRALVKESTASVGATAATQCECDYSDKLATTKFVWDVLTALGLTKIYHNHSNYNGGSGSSSSGT
ncbi:MAG: hypothetical protein K2N64_08155 [Anaeroplasmataceae bacterium]|nr:hypothetical protein [Anaeroplasmataceae bacterium]